MNRYNTHHKDAEKSPDEPVSYNHENDLDFGDIPAHLPVLSQAEEMLIGKLHVHVQVYQHHGQQYRHRGRVINFLRDTGSVYTQLPPPSPGLDCYHPQAGK